MPKAYDATTKHLIEAHPRDWLLLARMPVPARADAVTVVDADLSAITTASDKLIRVDKEIWTATQILMGLRYQAKIVDKLLKGVHDMEESTTYQAIIERGVTRGIRVGEIRGIAVGERQMLLRLGAQKFGPPDESTTARLHAINDPAELEELGLRVLSASSWNELLGLNHKT